MADRDIDVMLIVGRDGHGMRGDLRYVANYGPLVPFPHFAVFPREDVEPVFVAPTVNRSRIAVESGWVQETRSGWDDLHGKMLDELDGFRDRGRVGIARLDTIPVPLHLRLVDRYGSGNVCDAGPLLDAVRAVKSDEEIACARVAGRIADAVHEFLRDWVRPGRTDCELYAQVRRIVHEHGSDYSMDLLGIDGAGLYAPTGAVVGDDSFVEGEVTPSWSGLYNQLPFDFSFGEAARDRAPALEVLREAYAAGAGALGPGVAVSEVHAAACEPIDRSGLPRGPVHFGHGLGLDVIEGFSILPDTETVLQPGNLLVLHPVVLTPSGTRVLLGKTFAITADGSEPMNHVDVF